MEYFRREHYILVILDASISKADNYRLLQTLRSERPIPILVISSQESSLDRLTAFQAGANAYIGKPYTLEECLAQSQSLIHLYESISQHYTPHSELTFENGLSIKPDHRLVYVDKIPVDLTRKEFDLLFCLASHPDQVLSRE